MKIIKNNITRHIGDVSPDRMQIGAVINLNREIYHLCLYEKVTAIEENKRALFVIGDEEWEITGVNTIYKEVMVTNAGVKVTLRFKPQNFNSITVYMHIPGQVFCHNEGGDIFRSFIRCLCDEYECEINEQASYKILGADIKRDLDIPIKPFANMFKQKRFITTLKQQGHIYENFDLYHFEQKDESSANILNGVTDKTNRQSTIASNYNESYFSFHLGATKGASISIYDKDYENTTSKRPKLYDEPYKHLTRFECSLSHEQIKSFYIDEKQLITLDDFENNIASIFKAVFDRMIRVPKKRYSTRNSIENNHNWNKIVAGLSSTKVVKRKTSKLQNNPNYNKELYDKASITRVTNTICKNLLAAKNDDERAEFLNMICSKGMTEQYFNKIISDRNKNKGDISLEPKKAYEQILDSQHEAGDIVTQKISSDLIIIDTHSVPTMTLGMLNCGTEYIKVVAGVIYSALTYITAKRCDLLTNRCIQDIENGVVNMNECVEFYDLRHHFRKIIMS